MLREDEKRARPGTEGRLREAIASVCSQYANSLHDHNRPDMLRAYWRQSRVERGESPDLRIVPPDHQERHPFGGPTLSERRACRPATDGQHSAACPLCDTRLDGDDRRLTFPRRGSCKDRSGSRRRPPETWPCHGGWEFVHSRSDRFRSCFRGLRARKAHRWR